MSFTDTTLLCRDCDTSFTFTAEEQESYEARGFKQPARCPECRAKKRTNQRRGVESHLKRETVSPVLANTQIRHRALHPEHKPVSAAAAVAAGGLVFADFELDEMLQKSIDMAGYVTPTPIQASAIPILLDGKDIIGTAQTGTGKTAAFAIPIIQYLIDHPVNHKATRVLILAPTRELAEQIHEAFQVLCRFTDVRSATVYGGVGFNPQEKALRDGTEIIVACPGRLLDHMTRATGDVSRVEITVLDEADRMLDMGFIPDVTRILGEMPKERQTMLFSATFPTGLKPLTGALKNPERVSVDLIAPAKTVSHALYPCDHHLKTSLLVHLLRETDTASILVFTRTKHRANKVATQMAKTGYKTGVLHSNKSQTQRQEALKDFKSGRIQLLVATDIAARGLDIATVSHVINYDIPDGADSYIHRIGRTGRAEREGDAITLVTREDKATVREIEAALGSPIERKTLEDFDYNKPAPEGMGSVGGGGANRRSGGGSGRPGGRTGGSGRPGGSSGSGRPGGSGGNRPSRPAARYR